MDVFMTAEASYVGHHPYSNNNAYNVDDFVVTGLKAFNNLQEYNLPTPEAMFELEFFRKNPSVFYRFLHVGFDPLHS